MTTDRYLLDTCAMLFIARDEPVSRPVASLLGALPSYPTEIALSAFSAWEIGLLVAKGHLTLERDPLTWFRIAASRFDVEVLVPTPSVLVAASFLPEPMHGDPADRILIATARENDLTIITRDRAILAYGAAGHVKVLAC
ncbi:type II toxin-antitoxin system VapC family toxin [Rhizobium sp. YIM 134829]|uniref:type II toxin-antitoxin system VapC family toxin n=1 Tax=Rhizobium sp. YIM 134829 TaxID=3390453 RepID=UPI00397BA440